MIIIPFGVIWTGYLLAVWGYTLLKGYDVTLRRLGWPINPYQWPTPPNQPPLIQKSQVWPGQADKAAQGGGVPV